MAHVVVVGNGIAGLAAALRAAERHEVTIVTKAAAESNTRYAQGGIAAAVFSDDSVAAHIDDTMRAGAGFTVPAAAHALCHDGPQRVRELIALGAAFDRDSRTGLARGLEAAHSHARVLHAGGDATGAEIQRTLDSAVRAAGIRVITEVALRDIVTLAGTVSGVMVQFADGTEAVTEADAVILATGGWGQLYSRITNPHIATGDGVAAAWRAGALLADLEFTQFHPTALCPPSVDSRARAFLVSEAVRGEGAVLRNAQGERFMLDAHPDAELAPRDVVARSIAVEMAA